MNKATEEKMVEYATGAEAIEKMGPWQLLAAFAFLGGGIIPSEPGPYPDTPTMGHWRDLVFEEFDRRCEIAFRHHPPGANGVFVEKEAPSLSMETVAPSSGEWRQGR